MVKNKRIVKKKKINVKGNEIASQQTKKSKTITYFSGISEYVIVLSIRILAGDI